MRNRPGLENRPQKYLTILVNNKGTLVEKRNPFAGLDLRSVSDHANHAKRRPPPPPKRSVYFVNTPPDFFHPYGPHTPLPRQNS